jgi:hypothetical protein
MEKAAGLADLLESRGDEPQVPDGIFPFGMLEDVLSVENVIDNGLDQLARFVHEAYLSTVAEGSSTNPNAQPWERLAEIYRKENRQGGDHLAAKLRGIGCRVSLEPGNRIELSDEEVDLLARMEKQRWNASRSIAGWRYGPVRSDLAKIHPLLVPWDRLPPEQQDTERKQIRTSLPLELGGLSVARQVVVAICADNTPSPEAEHKLQDLLGTWKAEFPGCHFVVSSMLNEGCERRLAKAALQILDADLQVVLPLPYELHQQYIEGYDQLSRDASLEEFEHLVGVADQYFEMPLRFRENRSDAEVNYAVEQRALARAYLYQRSDRMLALIGHETNIDSVSQMCAWTTQGFPEAMQFPNDLYPLRRPCQMYQEVTDTADQEISAAIS